MSIPLPKNETARLAALHSYGILDSKPEAHFDELTHIAAQVCRTPTALLSLVDHERQWHKASLGFHLSQIEREHSFCAHALERGATLTVSDALKDDRFKNNPLVKGDPRIRFYAGAPLINDDGYALGTLCVLDKKPRRLNGQQKGWLETLSRRVMTQLELRRQLHESGNDLDQIKNSRINLKPAREAQYRLAFEHGGLGMLIVNHELENVKANRALQRLLGLSSIEASGLKGMDFIELFKCDDVQDELREVITGRRDYFYGERCFVRKEVDQVERWFKLTAAHVRTPDGETRSTVITVDDITSHKENERRLLHDAFHDVLTGLPNRHLFIDRVSQAIDRLVRRPQQLFAVMFLDVDNFKPVNDTFGHEIGDRLLTRIAQKLTLCLRTADTIARFGGDEFTILLDPVTEYADAESIAERIGNEMRQPIFIEGRKFQMSLSVGIVLATPQHTRPEELLREADRAMYRAKVGKKVTLH